MVNRQKLKRQKRRRKALRVRNRVRGDARKPRLSVCRSCRYISVQAIDDSAGRTLAQASQLESELRGACQGKTKTEAAKIVGAKVAERLLAQGIERVAFDRGWYRYHGRVRALAEAAREAGLRF